MQIGVYDLGKFHGSIMYTREKFDEVNEQKDYNRGYTDGISLAVKELPGEALIYMVLSLPAIWVGWIGFAYQVITLTFIPWATVLLIGTIVVRMYMLRKMQNYLIQKRRDNLINKLNEYLKDIPK